MLAPYSAFTAWTARLPRAPRVMMLACAGLLAFCALLLLPAPARAQQIVAFVNGEPITKYDVEQRSKLIQLSTRKAAPAKQVLEELINEKVKVSEAKKFRLTVSDAEIDNALVSMGQRMRMNKAQLVQVLARSGIRVETLKAQIEAGIAWNQLVRGRFGKSLTVGEGDMRNALASQKTNDESANYEYRLLPVVLIVPRGADRAVLAARHAEAGALRKQITSCTDADRIFRSKVYGAVRGQITKTSADLPPPLRDILNSTEIGHLTAPEVTAQGIQMFALCDRRATKADSPAEAEARQKVFAEKYEKKSNAYLAEARRSMMIEYR